MKDPRLKGSHYRILATVSLRDGMRKDGRGCFASQITLQKDTNLNKSTLSVSIGDLVDWRYLAKVENPRDRRRAVYWTIYDHEVEKISLPAGKQEDCLEPNKTSEIDCSDNPQPAEKIEGFHSKRSLLIKDPLKDPENIKVCNQGKRIGEATSIGNLIAKQIRFAQQD